MGLKRLDFLIPKVRNERRISLAANWIDFIVFFYQSVGNAQERKKDLKVNTVSVPFLIINNEKQPKPKSKDKKYFVGLRKSFGLKTCDCFSLQVVSP